MLFESRQISIELFERVRSSLDSLALALLLSVLPSEGVSLNPVSFYRLGLRLLLLLSPHLLLLPVNHVDLGGIKGSASEPNERNLNAGTGKKKGKKAGPRKVKIISALLLCFVLSLPPKVM
jgi:hypothetical protein